MSPHRPSTWQTRMLCVSRSSLGMMSAVDILYGPEQHRAAKNVDITDAIEDCDMPGSNVLEAVYEADWTNTEV